MKISRREKILLLIAGYLLFIWMGFKFIINPTQAELDRVKATNSKIDGLVQKAVQASKQNNDSQAAISEKLASYLQLEEQLPRDKQLVELVDQFGNLADEKKVTLLSVNYIDTDTKDKTKVEQAPAQAEAKTKQTSNAGASKMNLSVSLVGSYYHLLGFLQALEKSPRIIIINSTDISVGQKQETAATTTSGPAGTYASSSSNPPPVGSIAQGTREQTAASIGASVPVQTTVSETTESKMTNYDLSNIQMNLQITSFYDATQLPIANLDL